MKRRAFVLAPVALIVASPARAEAPSSTARSRAAVRRVASRLAALYGAAGVATGAPVFVRIMKEEGALELWAETPQRRFVRVKAFAICRWSGGLGPKLREGDGQAPEGFYAVGPRRMNPASNFHLSFDLGFPNAYDRSHGRTGSALMVHGACVSIGCYAMTDDGIELIWAAMDAAFRAGQPVVRVHCFPFAMTAANLERQARNPNAPFWSNLKEGWDWFERTGRPPDVSVRGGRYRFAAA